MSIFNLSNRLREYLFSNGMLATDLENKTHIGINIIRSILSGKSDPSLQNALIICNALNIEPEMLCKEYNIEILKLAIVLHYENISNSKTMQKFEKIKCILKDVV